MNPIHTSLRGLLLCVLGTLAPAGCVPGSLSLGETESDTDSGSGSSDDAINDPADEGEVRWSTIRPDVYGTDVAVAPDGSIYVLGQAGFMPQGDGGTFANHWLGKHDESGVLLWEQLEPQPQPEEISVYPAALAVDDAGDVYLATTDYSVPAGLGNRVRKLDPDGVERWSVELPARVAEVVALPGGGAIVAGSQDDLAWVQHVDVDGTLGWSRTFGDPAMRFSQLTDAALTPDGGVVLGGSLGVDPASSRSQAWAVALELADGSERWQAVLSEGVVTDWVEGLGVAADGTVLAAGRSESVWIEALDAQGASQWSWTNDVAPGTTSLAVHPDGGFALGDGVAIPLDELDACDSGIDGCPSTLRVARLEPDRTVRWSLSIDQCRVATVVTPTADGGVLALASCPTDGDVGMGLLQLEP